MKKEKIIISIFLIVGLILLTVGVVFAISGDTTSKEKEKTPTGADSGLTAEEFNNWETVLNEKAVEIMDDTFGTNYTLDENGEFNVTLYELKEVYKKDLSAFTTPPISCDLEHSTVQVTKQNDDYIKSVMLICSNAEEDEAE